MKERLTQILLAIVAILLALHLIQIAPLRAANSAEKTRPAAAILRAQRIELVDERGQPRMQFSIEENGDAVMRIRDAKGTIRVKLSGAENGSGLALLNDRTEPGVHLSARDEGTRLTLAQPGRQEHVITP